MWVKICGNTNLEDAKLAAELGADALGFIFAPSKRQVTVAQVAAIAHELPDSIERVGVFDSHDAKAIAFIAQEARLNAVQLHGGFDEELLKTLGPTLSSSGISIIQTLHWAAEPISPKGVGERYTPSPAGQVAEQLVRIAASGVNDRVLIDSQIGGSPSGGTGIAFDWSAARSLIASAQAGLRIIVAGGLKPENVAAAVAELAPWGVDVSSGVEASIGRKDPDKIAQFIGTARAASPPE